MAKKGTKRIVSQETRDKLSRKAKLRAEAKNMYGDIPIIYSEEHQTYVPKELLSRTIEKPIETISPNNVQIEWEILQRLDEMSDVFNNKAYDVNFYPYRDKGRRIKGRLNGLYGGTHRTPIVEFFETKINSLSSDELEKYVNYLETKKERLIELLDWNNTKVKYSEEIENKVTEIMSILNDGQPLNSMQSEKYHDVWGELSE